MNHGHVFVSSAPGDGLKRDRIRWILSTLALATALARVAGCKRPWPFLSDRHTRIPADAVKGTPATDPFPPLTVSSEDVFGDTSADHRTMYYGKAGQDGGLDAFRSERSTSGWGAPKNLGPDDRCRPDSAGEWGPAELIVARFAGEPTLDDAGNLYFVHHCRTGGQNSTMLEADIYLCRHK